MKKSPASKKSPKTANRRSKKAAAKVAKKPAPKSGARKAPAKKKPVKARKSTRHQTAAFALDPRLTPCGCCCPGALAAGPCGQPEAGGKRGGKRRK